MKKPNSEILFDYFEQRLRDLTPEQRAKLATIFSRATQVPECDERHSRCYCNRPSPMETPTLAFDVFCVDTVLGALFSAWQKQRNAEDVMNRRFTMWAPFLHPCRGCGRDNGQFDHDCSREYLGVTADEL